MRPLTVVRIVLPRARNTYVYAASATGITLPDVRYLLVADPISIGPDLPPGTEPPG